jgi:hypothetical protein
MLRYHQVVGLDIGRHSVRAVLAARRLGEPILLASVRTQLPDDPGAIHAAVKELLDSNGWGSMPCILGLPGNSVVLRALQMDPDDPRSEQQIVSVEAEQYADAGPDGTILEHARMGDPAAPSLLLAVTRMDTVEHLLRGPMQRGFPVVDLVPTPVALYNAMIHCQNPGAEPFACIELGLEKCEIVIGTSTALFFARRIDTVLVSANVTMDPVGHDSFAIAEGHRTVDEERFVAEVRDCLSLHASQYPSPEDQPRSVHLCGPGAREPGIAERIERMVGLPTSCWRSLPTSGAAESDRMAIATGLALSWVKKNALNLSLLPPARKESMSLRWQKRYWSLGGIACVGTAFLVAAAAHISAGRFSSHVEAAALRLGEYHRFEEQVEALRTGNELLEARIEPLQVAVANGRSMRDVVEAMVLSKHRDDWITLIADAETYYTSAENLEDKIATQFTLASETETGSPFAFKEVVVEGFTPAIELYGLGGLAETITILRDQPVVYDADLLPDDKVSQDSDHDEHWPEMGTSKFALRITLMPGPDTDLEPGGPGPARVSLNKEPE